MQKICQNKTISLILVIVMLLNICPLNVWATEHSDSQDLTALETFTEESISENVSESENNETIDTIEEADAKLSPTEDVEEDNPALYSNEEYQPYDIDSHSLGGDQGVNTPQLSKMFFSAKGYGATEDDAFDIDPEFSPTVSEYTLTVLDSDSPSKVLMYATLGEDAATDSEIEVVYYVDYLNTDFVNSVTSGSKMGRKLSDSFSEKSLKGNTLTIKVGPTGETVEAYTVNIVRKATLSGLEICDQDGNAIELNAEFDRSTNSYVATNSIDPNTVLKVKATATAADEATVTVAGNTASSGTETQVTPAWDSDGNYTLVISVGGGNAESTQYSIQFVETSIEVSKIEISKKPTKTVYNEGEKFDPTGMKIKVFYADDSSKEISYDKILFSPSGELTGENKSVTISYGGKSVELPITVIQVLKGKGTKESPYELYTEADVRTLDYWATNGKSQASKFFKMMNDIVLTGEWNGIGDSTNPFCGDFDGGGFQITIPEGGKALFAKTRGAVIHDLKVYGSRIDDYGLVSNYFVDKQADYYAQFCELLWSREHRL